VALRALSVGPCALLEERCRAPKTVGDFGTYDVEVDARRCPDRAGEAPVDADVDARPFPLGEGLEVLDPVELDGIDALVRPVRLKKVAPAREPGLATWRLDDPGTLVGPLRPTGEKPSYIGTRVTGARQLPVQHGDEGSRFVQHTIANLKVAVEKAAPRLLGC
jgi:hypothetical protein